MVCHIRMPYMKDFKDKYYFYSSILSILRYPVVSCGNLRYPAVISPTGYQVNVNRTIGPLVIKFCSNNHEWVIVRTPLTSIHMNSMSKNKKIKCSAEICHFNRPKFCSIIEKACSHCHIYHDCKICFNVSFSFSVFLIFFLIIFSGSNTSSTSSSTGSVQVING